VHTTAVIAGAAGSRRGGAHAGAVPSDDNRVGVDRGHLDEAAGAAAGMYARFGTGAASAATGIDGTAGPASPATR